MERVSGPRISKIMHVYNHVISEKSFEEFLKL